mgnify:CR=1 FL=1
MTEENITGEQNREMVKQASIKMAVEASEREQEIVRHHRDFAAISKICYLEYTMQITPSDAIRQIRNIVG